MHVSDWINVGALILVSIGLAISLYFGFRSIRLTKETERKRYRHALLADVIDWATNVINWRSQHSKIAKDIVTARDLKAIGLLRYAHINEVKETFVGMAGRNFYIRQVAQAFGQSLQQSVETMCSALEEYVAFLDRWQTRLAVALRNGKEESDDYIGEADRHESLLDGLATDVIQKATDIQRTDMNLKW